MAKLVLYHGSQHRIALPVYGLGNVHNDYGLGFYCTRSLDLAKEWACPEKKDGIANRYILETDGLSFHDLTVDPNGILGWLATLLANRTFDISSELARRTREYLIDTFSPDLSNVDVITGYRADDSYFMFARDFLNGQLPLRLLEEAMRLGKLGKQTVLVSPEAFTHLSDVGYELASWQEWFDRRGQRDASARDSYQIMRRIEYRDDDIYAFDIYRERMEPDDERIRELFGR